jgi:NADH-quinone oxidoreductase subunit I
MWEMIKSIFFAIPRGLSVTFKYFLKKKVTVKYPDAPPVFEDRYRGLHYLTRYPDGKERCVCCGLCAVACPADAIYMEPAERNRKKGKGTRKYSKSTSKMYILRLFAWRLPREAIFLARI